MFENPAAVHEIFFSVSPAFQPLREEGTRIFPDAIPLALSPAEEIP
jgi:hypothetical protein